MSDNETGLMTFAALIAAIGACFGVSVAVAIAVMVVPALVLLGFYIVRQLTILQRARDRAHEEFVWLVELFLPNSGRAMGVYHTGYYEDGGASRTTRDAGQAWRYRTQEEAAQVAASLKGRTGGEWSAIQHGFAPVAAKG